jgi:hypothetical protein
VPDLHALSAPAWLLWQPGNVAEREQFIAAHDQRHRTYRLAATRAGRAISICPLTGEMNADWFSRHLFCHAAHQRIFPQQVTQSSTALEMPPTDDENALYSWMRRHALIHAALDAAYGVV